MSDRYQTGIVNADTDIPYAGARFAHEVYDMATDPAAPLCACDTPGEAQRVAALLNSLDANLAAARNALPALLRAIRTAERLEAFYIDRAWAMDAEEASLWAAFRAALAALEAQP